MHCDVDQEDSVGHIWQCLDEIGVERIDHGVNSLEDAALVKEIERRGLGLTVCPISNSYVAGGLKARELKRMLEQGVRATVNSDDPAYFPGYMNENLLAVSEARRPEPGRARAAARNSFTIAGSTRRSGTEYLARLETYADARLTIVAGGRRAKHGELVGDRERVACGTGRGLPAGRPRGPGRAGRRWSASRPRRRRMRRRLVAETSWPSAAR